jgi:hypothetical protein
MPDRTIKLLWTLLVVALWGFLLRPLFMPAPAHAQDNAALPATTMVEDHNTIYVTAGHKLNVFEYNRAAGSLNRVAAEDILFQ